MKSLFSLIPFAFFIAACSCSQKNGSSDDSKVELKITTFEKSENLEIISPETFRGMISATFLFQDSLIYILSGKSNNKIFRVNLDDKSFTQSIPLDPNFFSNPSGIYVHSLDSIFVSEFSFPVIYLINQSGEVLDTYNLYRENLWQMPKEGFSNFGLYSGYGLEFSYMSNRNSFIVALKQFDLWYFVDDKSEFPILAEFSLETKDFTNLFGTYPGVYGSKENYLLPFYLSHPILEISGDKIIVSFLLDHNLYIYDLEGNHLDTKIASIRQFQLSKPLRYDMNDFDEQGMSEYSTRGSFFTDFFYVKSTGNYVRIFNKCITNSEGFCKSRTLYTLIFDADLNLIEAKEIGSDYEPRYFSFQTGYRNGFISKLNQPSNDDLFPLNTFFNLD